MRKFEFLFAVATLLVIMSGSVANAEYWFQSGVRAGSSAAYNNGASVQIETVIPQSIASGSMAFWVGETLSNGAFLQIGYTIPNETGNITTDCTRSGCSNSTFVHAGHAEWFYEYFPPGNNDTFFGSTGPDGSAGTNGTFNTYAFYSLGSTWYFQVNNQTVGSADLGTASSNIYTPLAIAEIANTSGAGTIMKPVLFANLSAYQYDKFLPVSRGYATINYGVGSLTNIPNPYGVQEIGTRTNYFEVGSGLPTSANTTQLWELGYRLTINSVYGNISSKNTYVAYSPQQLSAPAVVNLTGDTRAVFLGWSGTGLGYYSGNKTTVQLLMTANITETAKWQIQYLVNVSSPYGVASGSGWYANGSRVYYSISNTSFLRNGVQEVRFLKWSSGATGTNSSSAVSGPANITAVWAYGSTLLGTNAYGQSINVSRYLINGQQFNSTPLLDTSVSSSITGAYYKGVWLNAGTVVTQNSPAAIEVPLPVYNVTIKTTDLFGFPINASVSLLFKNGTTESAYSGSGGLLVIPNVPYGYANATVEYLGMQESEAENGGKPASTIFISLLNIVEFVIIAAIFIYVADRSIKKELGKGSQGPKSKPQSASHEKRRQAQQQKRGLWSP
ncbi:MAG: hypothetical protein KGI04_03020 [Candidatus Micrarchaeota archaeon]|nr:hypothetical protein [Candidatus Micrarchaeota archaeon]